MALLLSAGLAFSQSSKLSFRTLALDNSQYPDLFVMGAGKAVPLAFSSKQPSPAQAADKGSPLKIYKGALDGKGKPADAAPSLVELPAASSVLLLAWTEAEKQSFVAVADAFATAKSGDWLVVNHTSKALVIQVGEGAEEITVEPKTYPTIKCTAPVGEGAATTVSVKQPDGSKKSVYSTYLPIYKDQRGLIVVVQNGERVRVNYISDSLAPPAAAGKAPKGKR